MGKVTFAGGKVGMKVPNVGLPSGYTELEYIKSSGTQYINTGVKATNNTRLVIDYRFNSGSVIYGAYDSNGDNSFGLQYASNKWYQYYGPTTSSGYTSASMTAGNRYMVDQNKAIMYVDEVSVREATAATFTANNPLLLCALYNASSVSNHSSIEIYSCQIYDNDTKVRDFVPCINPDGEIGLYDRVTKGFFGNAGTGYFSGTDLDDNAGSANINASDLAVHSRVKLNENGSPVEYVVVHKGLPSTMYDASCDGLWLLRKNIYENQQWHSSDVNDYENSAIHNYLNNSFFDLFDINTQSAIKSIKLPYRQGSGYKEIIASGSDGLETKIFLLSGFELGWNRLDASYIPEDGTCLSYFSLCSDTDPGRIATLNGEITYWWLRSPACLWHDDDKERAFFVSTEGHWGYDECSHSLGVRPALILPYTAIFDADTMILKGVA